jgi:hypothetical protein
MGDLKNIGIVSDAMTACEEIKNHFHLPDHLDAARLGFSYAILRRLQPSPDGSWGARNMTWHSHGIDDDRETLRSLVVLLFEEESTRSEPYRAIEALMNRGMLRLYEDLKAGQVTSIADLTGSGR